MFAQGVVTTYSTRAMRGHNTHQSDINYITNSFWFFKVYQMLTAQLGSYKLFMTSQIETLLKHTKIQTCSTLPSNLVSIENNGLHALDAITEWKGDFLSLCQQTPTGIKLCASLTLRSYLHLFISAFLMQHLPPCSQWFTSKLDIIQWLGSKFAPEASDYQTSFVTLFKEVKRSMSLSRLLTQTQTSSPRTGLQSVWVIANQTISRSPYCLGRKPEQYVPLLLSLFLMKSIMALRSLQCWPPDHTPTLQYVEKSTPILQNASSLPHCSSHYSCLFT